jgi:hypothetical protein
MFNFMFVLNHNHQRHIRKFKIKKTTYIYKYVDFLINRMFFNICIKIIIIVIKCIDLIVLNVYIASVFVYIFVCLFVCFVNKLVIDTL